MMKSKREIIAARYFRWVLRRRSGVFLADGRSNTPNLGRHSLGTKDRTQAMQRVTELDLIKAVEVGRADPSLLDRSTESRIGLQEGRKLYCDHLERPAVMGGASRSTRKRYRAALDKFVEFAENRGVSNWNEVGRRLVEAYTNDLERREYAPRTIYLEATLLKQLVKWLVEEKHIPRECLIRMPLKKVRGTATYCWTREEIAAMVEHCGKQPELTWLANVIVALANTGLRISELAALRWSSVDLQANVLRISNETGRRRERVADPRVTKNRRDRSLPIHADLCAVLARLPRTSGGRVFCGPRGGRLKPDTVRNILVREVITPLKRRFPTPEGEIGFACGRLHSFRHAFTSMCASAGVPERVLMKWLGHQSAEMVSHYYHLYDAEAQRQMRKLDFSGDDDGSGADDCSPRVHEVEAPPERAE